MNSRERFLETMRFKKGARPPKWEYAYWGATIKRWYREGLPEQLLSCHPHAHLDYGGLALYDRLDAGVAAAALAL